MKAPSQQPQRSKTIVGSPLPTEFVSLSAVKEQISKLKTLAEGNLKTNEAKFSTYNAIIDDVEKTIKGLSPIVSDNIECVGDRELLADCLTIDTEYKKIFDALVKKNSAQYYSFSYGRVYGSFAADRPKKYKEEILKQEKIISALLFKGRIAGLDREKKMQLAALVSALENLKKEFKKDFPNL